MGNFWRNFVVLMWKNYIVHKRNFPQILLLRFFFTLIMLIILQFLRDFMAKNVEQISSDTHYPVQTKNNIMQIQNNLGSISLYFSPKNAFTDDLIKKTESCLNANIPVETKGFYFEKELLKEFALQDVNRTKQIVAVIFKNSDRDKPSTMHLKYKIKSGIVPISLFHELYKTPDKVRGYEAFIEETHFVKVQICLDESFLNMKLPGATFKSEISIQQIPYPPYVKVEPNEKSMRDRYAMTLVTLLCFVLLTESIFPANEKCSGVHILISMNGVQNYQNLLSWLLSGLLCSLILIIPAVIFLKIAFFKNAIPYLNYGNIFIFLLLIASHITHLITFGIHISAYCSQVFYIELVLILVYLTSIGIDKYILTNSTYDVRPYLGIFFPAMLLTRIFDEMHAREYSMVGIQWNNLFVLGDLEYATTVSLGVVFIFSILGTLLHFFLSLYVYSILPGKYGVPKHPLYFLQFLRSKKFTSEEGLHESDHNAEEMQFFEKIEENIFIPGIQIRNLEKHYITGFLNGEKNKVLQGISADFYQGQITALLGHNGAGKSTMMSIITGTLSPTKGTVLINGKNTKDEMDQIRNDLGLCHQNNIFLPDLNVFEQIQFLALLKNKNNKSGVEIKKDIDVLLSKLKLSEKSNVMPTKLSGGQQRRVSFGMAIIGDASTLILDEPTSGMDPESRRDIWDILLKMRGEKTIIISTHNMEEADVLGDRTAIIHQGRLTCYGTPNFLKKIYGEGNVEVILSTEKDADSDKIMKQLNKNSQLIDVQSGKMTFNVSFTSQLPDNLDKIEERKKELGVTGISVSFINLEQVFLKATKEDKFDINTEMLRELPKVKSFKLFMQMAMALIFKKVKYTQRNIFTFLYLVLFPTISVIIIAFNIHGDLDTNSEVQIKLNMYRDAKVLYSSNDKVYGQKYKSIVEGCNGNAKDIGNINISKALIDFGRNDRSTYRRNFIAAATIEVINSEKIYINALYSGTASFSIPISINLAFNTLIKSLIGEEYQSDLYSQKFPDFKEKNYSHTVPILSYILITFMILTVPIYIIHPLRESLSGIKNLQKMTGVSSWLYWGTLFVFDFFTFIISTMLILLGFYIMDIILDIRLLYATEAIIMIKLFSLFAVNGLLTVYINSFLKMEVNTIMDITMSVPFFCILFATMLAYPIFLAKDPVLMNSLRRIQKNIFLLFPYVSFFHSQFRFLTIASQNAECRRMPNYLHDAICAKGHKCCSLNCFDGKCQKHFDYYQDKENFPFDFPDDVNLGTSEFFMTLTCFIYFSILIVLELKIIPFLYMKIRRFMQKEDSSFHYVDDQVKVEKLYVANEVRKLEKKVNFANSLENIEDENFENDNDAEKRIYLVYNLKKTYGKCIAVRDISFGVKKGECFGLLGVNGAGKSTTFRILTGEEFPNDGNIYLETEDFFSNKKKHLAHVGYCPQQTVLIGSLSARDHLKLFAYLRGIAASHVTLEVEKWIKMLNLSLYAAQPSETLSGGNQRRLNTAISMIGNPKILLLDEPTSGVDPATRRIFRDVIKSCQLLKQSIILSSHSMDECDTICNRLVIMVQGELICIGQSQQLKQRFGAGFDINIKLHHGRSDTDVNSIKKNIEESLTCTLSDEHMGYITYHVRDQKTKWKTMYRVMENLKKKYSCIEDFTIVSATLEQLFLKFAREKSHQNSVSENNLSNVGETVDPRTSEAENNSFLSLASVLPWRTPRNSTNNNLSP